MTPRAIRALRVHFGVTQAQLASMLGCSTPQVCHWERGRREPDAWQRSILHTMAESLALDPAVATRVHRASADAVRALALALQPATEAAETGPMAPAPRLTRGGRPGQGRKDMSDANLSPFPPPEPELVRHAFGVAARSMREALDLRATDVARYAGMRAERLSRIERGARVARLDEAVKICSALGVRLEDLDFPRGSP